MSTSDFSHDLLAWYDAGKRGFSWRENPTPYAVWISEIMAQQTQMERVVQYHARWMERYPDVKSLADAHEEDVLKMWEGLGYYSRARNIHKSAKLIMSDFDGEIPSDVGGLRSLPGVGDYTAGAVASIAFGQCEIALDANVLRVFSRLLDLDDSVKERATQLQIAKAVRAFMPEGRPGDYNQALMEFGALVCSKSPRCQQCPVAGYCRSLAAGTVDTRPVLPPSKKKIHIDMATGVLLHEGQVLVQKRRLDDVWPGLWEFPGGVIEAGERPEQALVREYMEEVVLPVSLIDEITVVSYNYTKYRVTMHCFLCRYSGKGSPAPEFLEAVEGGFVTPQSLSKYAFPAGHRRLVEFMRGDMRYSHLFDKS